MILTTVMILGSGLALGLSRRPEVDLSGTARVFHETYGDTATAPVPADMKRLTRRIEPVLRVVGKDGR